MGLGRAHGGAGPRAARKRGERGTGELGPGKEMALTCGSGRSVAGRGARAGRAGCGCQVGRLGCGAGCQRDAAAGDARASAERAEWLTGWSAMSVGDARGRRGLSGDGFAEPEGKEGRAGVGLLGWAAGVDVGRVLGREGEEVGRSGLGCCWAGFLVLVFLSISLFLILIQTQAKKNSNKFEFKL